MSLRKHLRDNHSEVDAGPLNDVLFILLMFFLLVSTLAKNVVSFEPHTALFVPDKDPLIFYEKIAAFSKTHLQAKGMIYLETHEDLAKEVATLFNKDHSNTEIKKDIFGKDRMVIVTT